MKKIQITFFLSILILSVCIGRNNAKNITSKSETPDSSNQYIKKYFVAFVNSIPNGDVYMYNCYDLLEFECSLQFKHPSEMRVYEQFMNDLNRVYNTNFNINSLEPYRYKETEEHLELRRTDWIRRHNNQTSVKIADDCSESAPSERDWNPNMLREFIKEELEKDINKRGVKKEWPEIMFDLYVKSDTVNQTIQNMDKLLTFIFETYVSSQGYYTDDYKSFFRKRNREDDFVYKP